jgi:hypothetical protein
MTPEDLKKQYPLFQRECHLCGCPLAIGTTVDGKTVPLDLRSPVYAIVYEKSDAHSSLQVVRTELAAVNHYATCPHANAF